MDQYIGKMLDNRYEILERIGTGGMAVVYKAKYHRLNRLVAIKILKSDLAQNEEFRRRFNAESQAVAQLSHPNIVSVYDVSRGGDTEYIVMELIDGITLKQYMEKRGQLNWRESLHFITQIMRGLSHAHSRGIIHRDIKPQNIMVLRDGSVKVADFGIACLANQGQTLTPVSYTHLGRPGLSRVLRCRDRAAPPAAGPALCGSVHRYGDGTGGDAGTSGYRAAAAGDREYGEEAALRHAGDTGHRACTGAGGEGQRRIPLPPAGAGAEYRADSGAAGGVHASLCAAARKPKTAYLYGLR